MQPSGTEVCVCAAEGKKERNDIEIACAWKHRSPSLTLVSPPPRQATCHLAQTSSSLMKHPMCSNVESPWPTPEQYIFFGRYFQPAMRRRSQWMVPSVLLPMHGWTGSRCAAWSHSRRLYRFILCLSRQDTFQLRILVFLQSRWSFYVNNVHLWWTRAREREEKKKLLVIAHKNKQTTTCTHTNKH